MPIKFNKNRWIKTVQFLAAYLVAAWTFLQFVDWILIRYDISPHWVDILLWLFIGIIPSLLIYLYHQERINKRVLKLREKIIIPLNILLLAIGLYFGFGNSDLGATTKEIKFTNESGLTETKTITKEEFRIGIPIYNFENTNKEDSINWMTFGIGKLLCEDLLQNKSLSPDYSYTSSTIEKIREASLFYDFYVDGKYEKKDSIYEITTYLRKATNGKILHEKKFVGKDFMLLLDDISVFITNNSGFVETRKLTYLDFPINEFITDSEDALREFIKGNYTKAISIDSTFALAYLRNAKQATRYNRGTLEVQDIIDKAFKYRNKLPLQKQLEVYMQRNLAYGKFEEAEKQVKLQLEVDPNNSFYNQVLYAIYGETRQTARYFEKSKKLFEREPNPSNGTNLAIASMVSGNDDELMKEIKKYELINPGLSVFKLQPLLFKGKIDAAAQLLKDLKTQYPNLESRSHVYDTVVTYLTTNLLKNQDLEQYTGRYRSINSEQIQTFWVENNRLLQFVKNQKMMAFIPAGPQSIVSGFINNTTWRYDLLTLNSGKPIGFKMYQHHYNKTGIFWYWKEDQSIIKAHEAYNSGNLLKAKSLYEVAIIENPEHAYLQNILQHINYVNTIGKTSVLEQNKTFSGIYGAREFWIEDDKFYYKRKSDDMNIPRVELLAINENEYIDLTRPNTKMEFIKDESGKTASYSSEYKIEEKKWISSEKDTNYFLKDD